MALNDWKQRLETLGWTAVLKLSNWPRNDWSDWPLLAQFISLPGAQLALGEELIPPGESDLIRRMIELLKQRHRHSYPAGVRPMLRDFHTKAQGGVLAWFTVDEDLPSEYRYGVFASLAPDNRFRAVVRFSNGLRGVGHDALQSPHGMAIKLFDVPDPKPDDANAKRTVDFVLADYPVNLLGTVAEAYEFYQLEAADKPQAYFISPLPLRLHLRTFAIGALSAREGIGDVLDQTYYSQTPYRLGGGAACKYIVRPRVVKNDQVDTTYEDYLRDQLVARLRQGEVEFDFFVQRQRHPVRQPVENASIEWDEGEAPPIKVGTLTLERYGYDTDVFTGPWRQWCCERAKFSPTNALPDQKPIGGINRLRRAVYQALAKMRSEANQVSYREPESLGDYSGQRNW
jgi:hypothetical protein